MKKCCLLIICLLIFTGCQTEARHVRLMDNVISNFSKEVRKSENLQSMGYGGSMYGGVVKLVTVTYEKDQFVEIAEARKILVENTEKLIERINKNEAVRPYLDNYPFTHKNVFFGIFFKYSRTEKLDKEYIAYAFAGKYTISYDIFNSDTQRFEQIYEEDYQDALKIVMSEEAECSN